MSALSPEPETPQRVDELYLDDDLLVIAKPAGLPTHPSSRYVEGTVVNRLRQQYGERFAWPVHRLDRETSGVMVCARTKVAARCLSMAFANREVSKEYLALCEGAGPESGDAIVVDAPIASGGPRIRIGVRIDADAGKAARTRLTCEATFTRNDEAFSLWRARPEHGRRHQVRVHLRHAGWPIVGDKIYGPCDSLYEAFIAGELDAAAQARLRMPRHALHAAAITLQHPLTLERLRFVAPMAGDMCSFLAQPAGTLCRYSS